MVTAEERAPGLRTYGSAEEQDIAPLRDAMQRTPDEKFAFLMGLIDAHAAIDAVS